RGALEDELADRRVGPGAGGEDVHRPDHVVLVGRPRRGDDRVHDQPGVDDRVDLRGTDDPLDQRVLVRYADELGSLELAGRVLAVGPDDRLDRFEALERLREAAAPVARDAGDENPSAAHPNQTDRRFASISWRFSWIRARISWATVWTSALSSAASAPPSG